MQSRNTESWGLGPGTSLTSGARPPAVASALYPDAQPPVLSRFPNLSTLEASPCSGQGVRAGGPLRASPSGGCRVSGKGSSRVGGSRERAWWGSTVSGAPGTNASWALLGWRAGNGLQSPQRASTGLAEEGASHCSLPSGRNSELRAKGQRDWELVRCLGGCGLRCQLLSEPPSWRYQAPAGPSCPALRRSAALGPCMRLLPGSLPGASALAPSSPALCFRSPRRPLPRHNQTQVEDSRDQAGPWSSENILVILALGLTCHTPLMSQALRMDEPSTGRPSEFLIYALASTLRLWGKGCQVVSDLMNLSVWRTKG